MPANKNHDFDPTLPETFDGIYEEFKRLRSSCPVAHSNAFDGFWALSKYHDVKHLLDNIQTYTTVYKNVVPVMSLTSRRAPLHLDPPEHTPYRHALDRVLSKKRVDDMTPSIRESAKRLMGELVAKGTGDLVADFTRRFPVEVFGQWFSLSDTQVNILQDTAKAYTEAWESADLQGVQMAGQRLTEMAEALIEERSVRPLDIEKDPISSLLSMTYEGAPFPLPKVVGCVRQILVVGLVAPPIFLGSVAVHLSRHPELQAQLRANPELIPAATEEFLRMYTPYRGFARTARHEVTIGGKTIQPDEPIAMLYASANRDEDVFEDPDTFILNRPNIRQHLAFGHGPHSCAGAPLARVELAIGIEEMLRQTKDFEIIGEPVMSGMPEVGPVVVPIKVTPA